ncbi:protein PIN-LIKES 7-like isoform X2 [Hibiscus syriacus]|uniref:protein PIN-LIKES 7-like isoform X2 n=1 Tax=Hibiscus syriacus TaxID=106335 RepID=UPI001921D972|nr:protein PIN-LIKES 7-like isoform X2 [Hibiscus syriacus]
MGFWTLFEVACMPILQVLIISLLGAFMATDYCKLLPEDTRRYLNKLVFVVFTPSLMFASLAKTVTLQDIISWWFMPINVGITYLVGGIIGWIVVKILRPKPHLEGLIIATCSSGNMGNLLLIVVPAVCNEDGSPFGNRSVCNSTGLSYASFSLAIGGFYVWTISYQMVKTSAMKLRAAEGFVSRAEPNNESDATAESLLLKGGSEIEVEVGVTTVATKGVEDLETQAASSPKQKGEASLWVEVLGFFHQVLKELLSPPNLGAILGFIFGATTPLRNLVIGAGAPLRVIQDSTKLLGDATIPCITLIIGANLVDGIRSSLIKPSIIIGVVCVRYVILPVIGIWVVKAAGNLGLLSSNPLFRYVLMIQFALPPASNIGTITQLFGVGQEECSVLFLWTYLIATFALTTWSTIFMWILT